jgi:hypothetical protein
MGDGWAVRAWRARLQHPHPHHALPAPPPARPHAPLAARSGRARAHEFARLAARLQDDEVDVVGVDTEGRVVIEQLGEYLIPPEGHVEHDEESGAILVRLREVRMVGAVKALANGDGRPPIGGSGHFGRHRPRVEPPGACPRSGRAPHSLLATAGRYFWSAGFWKSLPSLSSHKPSFFSQFRHDPCAVEANLMQMARDATKPIFTCTSERSPHIYSYLFRVAHIPPSQ